MTPSSSGKNTLLVCFYRIQKEIVEREKRALHVLERVKAEHVSALKTITMVGHPGAFGSGET